MKAKTLHMRKPLLWYILGLCVLLVSFCGILIMGVAVPGVAPIDLSIEPGQLPAMSEKQSHTLLFVGDIMLSRSVGAKMARDNDYLWPFRALVETLSSADVLFGNLESVISDKGQNVGSVYSFRADPRAIEGLQYAGFDVVSVANNHAADWTREAFADSIVRLRAADIAAVGGGLTEGEAYNGVIIERNGLRVGFLAYTDLIPLSFAAQGNQAGVARIDRDRIVAAIQTLEAQTDYIVVSYHFGEEYQTQSNATQQELAHYTIDAGADFVIGHHPHVTQEIELYHGGLIAYSLGNFVFDQHWSTATAHSMILVVTIENGSFSYSTIPIEIKNDYQVVFS